MTKEFKFHEKDHYYTLGGIPMHGVTTVISKTLPKPLTWWAAGMALEPLGWTNPKKVSKEDGYKKAEEFIKTVSVNTAEPQIWYDFLQTCYRRHDTYKKERGEAGTDVHALVETYINSCIKQGGDPLPFRSGLDPEEIKQFTNWAIEAKVKFLASEKQVYSEKNWFAGTLDFLFEQDGKTFVGDIKTSKEIYPEHFIQAGAYQVALNEQGTPTEGSVIVKLNGKIETKWSYDTLRDRGMFLNCLAIYKGLQTFN